MYFWHIQNRPTSSSWDRYYAQSTMGSDQRNASITSGIAAALTIAIFFVVFLLTFCCRLITGHRRRQERGQLANNHPPDADDFAAPPGYSLHDQQPHQNRMFVICGSNSPSSAAPPLPSYKDALNMFSVEKTAEQPSPPPFNAPFKLPQSNKSEATDDSCQYRNNSSSPSPPPPFPHSMPAAESESGEMASNQSRITTEAFEENGTNLDDLNDKQSKK